MIWSGQLLSTLGTRMTNFALSIWIWDKTGRASDLALMTFCAFLATAVFSPIAGSLIDRWDRRLTIIISDVGSLVSTLGMIALFWAGSAAVWQLYLINIVTGACLAFQVPVYNATISQMMSKEKFPRANAMMSLSKSVPGVFAPGLAAVLLTFADIKLILAVDALSYVVAIGTIFLVTMPEVVKKTAANGGGRLSDSLFGFRYMIQRPGLLGLSLMTFTLTVLAAMGWIVLTPMIMARTGGDQSQVGVVQAVGAIGGVIGGVVVGALRPTERKMVRILPGIVVFSVLGRVLLGLGQSVVFWSVGWFFAWSCLPFILSYEQAIWQQKVAPEVQGRVFAARNLVDNLAPPIAFGTAGPISDFVLEPAMRHGGALARVLRPLVGNGAGSGMALIFVFTGLLGVLLALGAFLFRPLREVESRIPDHDDEYAKENAPETV
ncbi:MFS transporter (plasmid) [Streptomyces sp. NBC_01136]|uniref:MFS transporter n=2 Tax=unclassified Streptomyces TaxID=2593676 RepID=UPI0038679A72|nr:MFS transporter [Streptomyces sp. NBC_01136]